MIRTSVFNLRSYCPKRIGEICSQTILPLDDTTKKNVATFSPKGKTTSKFYIQAITHPIGSFSWVNIHPDYLCFLAWIYLQNTYFTLKEISE